MTPPLPVLPEFSHHRETGDHALSPFGCRTTPRASPANLSHGASETRVPQWTDRSCPTANESIFPAGGSSPCLVVWNLLQG